MRKIVIGLASTVSALVLLFSYHTSTNSTAAKQATTDTNAGTGNSGGTTPNSSDGTYTGTPASTQFGDVQVQITVVGGKITSADAIQYPNGNRHDQQINAYAIPILNSEVVAAQSASIDAVSGATVTSDGYLSSLQSAIDAAHLG